MVLCPSPVAQSSFSFSPLPLKKKKKKKKNWEQVLSFGCARCRTTYKCKCFVKCRWKMTYLLCLKKLLHTLFTVKCFNNQFFGFMFQRPNLLLLQTYHETLHTLNHSEAEIKFETNCTNSYILKWFFISKFQLSQSLKSF